MIDVRPNVGLNNEAMRIDQVRKLCVFSVIFSQKLGTDWRQILDLDRLPSDGERTSVVESAERVCLTGKFDIGVSRNVIMSSHDFTEESTFYLFARRDVRYAIALKVTHEVMET